MDRRAMVKEGVVRTGRLWDTWETGQAIVRLLSIYDIGGVLEITGPSARPIYIKKFVNSLLLYRTIYIAR